MHYCHPLYQRFHIELWVLSDLLDGEKPVLDFQIFSKLLFCFILIKAINYFSKGSITCRTFAY